MPASSMMFAPRHAHMSFRQKVANLNWFIVLIVAAIGGIGVMMLYSVAGGSFDPWAKGQLIRFAVGFILMLFIALTDLRIWMLMAWPGFLVLIGLLVLVEFVGDTGMGGQRWLDIGFFRLQPSEFVKVGVVLVLASYFHSLPPYRTEYLRNLVVPLIVLAIPALLVVRQPDLGTTLMIVAGAASVVFLAGARAWIFAVAGGLGFASIPIAWNFLQDYQKARVLTFLDPERDPLGAGYQILQSQIALGSGGLWGKGFMQGTQSQLNFLPEMKTDFIFTVLSEEFGLIGGLALLGMYAVIILYGIYVSLTCRSQFGRLLAAGLSFTIFLYVFVNVAMVMGLVPVVGVPLPLVSYGGSAIITVMAAVGLILSVALNRSMNIPRSNPLS